MADLVPSPPTSLRRRRMYVSLHRVQNHRSNTRYLTPFIDLYEAFCSCVGVLVFGCGDPGPIATVLSVGFDSFSASFGVRITATVGRATPRANLLIQAMCMIGKYFFDVDLSG